VYVNNTAAFKSLNHDTETFLVMISCL